MVPRSLSNTDRDDRSHDSDQSISEVRFRVRGRPGEPRSPFPPNAQHREELISLLYSSIYRDLGTRFYYLAQVRISQCPASALSRSFLKLTSSSAFCSFFLFPTSPSFIPSSRSSFVPQMPKVPTDASEKNKLKRGQACISCRARKMKVRS